MSKSSTFLPELPADHYGVHVENEMDARRLLYLVEQIGAGKIISSADKYSQKYPGSKIFVSKLLTRHRIKVPAKIFAPTNIPVYRVYLLVNSSSQTLKIGLSGDWLTRVMRFSQDGSMSGFDLDRSISINFLGDKKTAMDAEKMAKRIFYESSVSPPDCIPFGAYGHKEWFRSEIYEDAVTFISTFNASCKRNSMTLRNALTVDIMLKGDSHF